MKTFKAPKTASSRERAGNHCQDEPGTLGPLEAMGALDAVRGADLPHTQRAEN